MKHVGLLKYVIETGLCECIIPEWAWTASLYRLGNSQTDENHTNTEQERLIMSTVF